MGPIPIYTYLHGQITGKTTGILCHSDEPKHPLMFVVEPEEYCAYVHEKMLAHCQLILFDGFILPDGLSKGSCTFDYEHGRITDKYRTYGVKKIVHVEKTATMKRGSEFLPSFSSHEERDVNYVRGVTAVTLQRHLIAIPIGHTVLGYRIRPRSLLRQYTCIEAKDDNVIFRSIVK